MSYEIEMDLSKNPETSEAVLEKMVNETKFNDVLVELYFNPSLSSEMKSEIDKRAMQDAQLRDTINSQCFSNYNNTGYILDTEKFKVVVNLKESEDDTNNNKNLIVKEHGDECIIPIDSCDYIVVESIVDRETGEVFSGKDIIEQNKNNPVHYCIRDKSESLYIVENPVDTRELDAYEIGNFHYVVNTPEGNYIAEYYEHPPMLYKPEECQELLEENRENIKKMPSEIKEYLNVSANEEEMEMTR